MESEDNLLIRQMSDICNVWKDITTLLFTIGFDGCFCKQR